MLTRAVVGVLAGLGLAASVHAAASLDIYFIDVEGGSSTLIVTPARESILMDAGYAGRGGRDPDRIVAAARDAGIDRIDVLVITHFHPDHAGGVPELAERLPIRTIIDYGQPLGTVYGVDRMTTRTFAAYDVARTESQHEVAHVGDRLPVRGADIEVVSAGGEVLKAPLPGAGQDNGLCPSAEDQPEDGTENFRSVGVMLEFGAFRFLNLGDLSGNTLTSIVCPRDLLGPVSVYLVAHHGDYDTNVPAVYAAIAPRVAVMNNGLIKGGSPDALRTLQGLRGLEQLWQLHASQNERARNVADDFIANVDEASDGHWIKLAATADGAFQVVNSRNGLTRSYAPSFVPTSH